MWRKHYPNRWENLINTTQKCGVFFSNFMECASICTSKYFCSAFKFNEAGQVCEIGSKENLASTMPNVSASIQVYVSQDFVGLGNYEIIPNCNIYCLYKNKTSS